MASKHTRYRLGLDMGTNSIGWAAIKLDASGQPIGVLDMGARIFPDGREDRSDVSNAAARRLARGQRRRRDRYVERRADLMDKLVCFGLMPEDETERESRAKLDPYKLRARALDETLEPFELGRALFHLNQRRGFKSNRKATGGDENEAGKTREAIDSLREKIRVSGARTLGEFLAWRHKERETVRARDGLGLYPDRAMYQDEFDKIRDVQEPYHTLTAEQWDHLRDYIIFYQRRLRAVKPGLCLLEEGENRAAKALPAFQEFRMLQEVNNLRLRVGTEPERHLDEGERNRALERLRSGLPIKLSAKDGQPLKPTRDLDLPCGTVFNLATGGRREVKGDETAARLKKPALFGKNWLELPLDERDQIARFLLETEDPEIVRQKALTEWGLTEAQADAVSIASLPSGYGNLSEKAIRKLIPHMEAGLIYSDAVSREYPHHSDFRAGEALDSLPYYGKLLERDVVGADSDKDLDRDGEPARYGRIPNPTVHIGLGQLRRVVNKLIEVYGKPEDIVVELARDLKSNKAQKDSYSRQQREGGARNERFREMIESAEMDVTPDALHKLRVWEEQGSDLARVCPYSGKTISFEMAMDSRTEIDHILPFSRTLDNSISNMVLCVAEANRVKGDRSPYEAFGHSPDGYQYDEILTRAKKLPVNKRWRFLPDAMERFDEEDRFLDRQLNETRYLSRTARAYLAHLYDEKAENRLRVRVIPGRMTALLRYSWGLNGMLSESAEDSYTRKQRDDHRHHAIDAFVVANTTQGLLQRFARASASGYHNAEERLAKLAPLPWEEFSRNQLKPHLDKIIVSHKLDHGTRSIGGKTTGHLHNDTAYGLVELSESGASRVVHRKPVSELKKADLDEERGTVRDLNLREALRNLWNQVEAEGEKPAVFAERAATQGVILGKRRQRVRRVRVESNISVVPIQYRDQAGNPYGDPYKGYKLDGNEFAEIWQMSDRAKSWKIVAVPTFYANQPDFDIKRSRPTTSRGKHRGKPDPTAKRLMRLHINDMGALGEGDERRIVRVRRTTKGAVHLDEHNEANVDSRVRSKEIPDTKFSASKLRELGFRKVHVDEIGRVRDTGPRK